jgi:hypothetical protein
MFIDELRSMGREVPPEPMLDTEVDIIVHTVPPGASTFTTLKVLVGAFRKARAKQRELATLPSRTQVLRGPHGEDPYLVAADQSLPLAEVILTPDAAATLARMSDELIVALHQEIPEGSGPVAVYVETDRVGVLSPPDSRRYSPALQAAQRAGRTLMVHGRLSHGPDGQWRLEAYAAGIL